MSDLTAIEKRKLERLLGMDSGYVLNFSNHTFEGFVLDYTERSIYDSKYDYGSGSKANRLRGFWKKESNGVVAKLLGALIEYGISEGLLNESEIVADCRSIVSRLVQNSWLPEFDALSAVAETIAKAVRESIEKNELEGGLDRLHTFVIKYVRLLCKQRGIPAERDKALHSLFGQYVKRLHDGGHIESEITARILKSSISTLEAFNDVRNNQSLAHDNPLLNYDEALLIFNHIANLIQFLQNSERRLKSPGAAPLTVSAPETVDDIPF
jgi:Abortive infection C-terminus